MLITKKNSSLTETDCFCQGRINRLYPRCHLVFTALPCPYGIPAYPRQITPALRCRILGPKAVHCTLSGPFDRGFLPGFQHPGLSGRACLPLSPLQRFVGLTIPRFYSVVKRNLYFQERTEVFPGNTGRTPSPPGPGSSNTAGRCPPDTPRSTPGSAKAGHPGGQRPAGA